ncbi:sodium-dependent bicarbonate transport family permease [Phormidium sp. CCY1219]|uniref:sodium-dependent bicarbonate transport family permease n=1 Tax=Phormidium sp. CCY1219 TaxID=2886104 RepID=UPI002D1E8285|nr:sodium-dependent bicarbonate transport family permease [Phormidium sp. CCY1219]MEB3831585.1 sodium-dependent bicarbonate transport family permease [Phormidium sp. CCY1219]
MDFLLEFLTRFFDKLQSPTLGFLIGGMVIAALNSRLQIPDSVYKFIVFMLLMRVGLKGGIAIRQSNLAEMLLPALFAAVIGIVIVFIARHTLARLPKIITVDAIATGGLFGAVSGSTLAAGLTMLESEGMQYEAWAAALYPFMDIPALVTAIVLASIYTSKQKSLSKQESLSKEEYLSKQAVAAGDYPSKPEYPTSRQEYRSQQRGSEGKGVEIWPIVKESLQGSALSALLLGIVLGIITRPDSVYESFFNPGFRGLLSVLMLVMGMEAWSRIGELRKVAQWYVVYAFVAPLLHGLIGFGLGYIAHITTGFSPGGVVILAVIAASSSDISGPPTLRAGIPKANPSAYIGSSTAVGTPVALAVGIPLFIGLAQAMMGS